MRECQKQRSPSTKETECQFSRKWTTVGGLESAEDLLDGFQPGKLKVATLIILQLCATPKLRLDCEEQL